MNVIQFLLAAFQAMGIPESSVNVAEMELTENLEKILLSSIVEIHAVEAIEEETLDFKKEFKNYEVNAVEDDMLYRNGKDKFLFNRFRGIASRLQTKSCGKSCGPSNKKQNLSIEIVQKGFKLVNSACQLRHGGGRVNSTMMELRKKK